MNKLTQQTRLVRALTAAGVVCSALTYSNIATAAKNTTASESLSATELTQMVKSLTAQNKILLEKLEKIEATQAQQMTQTQQQAAQVQQQAVQVQQQAQVVEKVQQDVKAATLKEKTKETSSTTISGYGEVGFTRPSKSPKDTNVDVQRAVIGINHRFDDKTKVVAEFEWEHAITSAGDKGEAEVEQLWVEREFQPNLRGRAGLFLMPVGLVNQNHEPTAYYGVYRPSVDTKIIPSTWREVGLGISGDTSYGLTWDAALTSTPNLSKWAASSTEGRVRGPLASTHGEGQFAAARDLGGVVALNWRGVPGLLLGGSVVYDSIGQHQKDFLGNNSKLLMLDLHARYQIAKLDLAGEIIRATISHTEDLNASFSASSTTNPTLVPSLFYGGYLQAGYRLWEQGDYVLKPFIRYEILNTAAGFGSLPVTSGNLKQPDEKIWTVGANLDIGEGVVLKADYRKNKQNKLPDTENHFNLGDSFNLGVGFSF